jgi:putative endonuclease
MEPATNKTENRTFFTYLLRCADGSFYCGWTVNLKLRLSAHNQGKGARYTRVRLPVELVYFEEFASRRDAMKRENQIKNMDRQRKTRLINRKAKNEF